MYVRTLRFSTAYKFLIIKNNLFTIVAPQSKDDTHSQPPDNCAFVPTSPSRPSSLASVPRKRMASSSTILQESIWNGSLPLEIRISPSECRIYDKADPYLVRFSPFPSCLPDLSATDLLSPLAPLPSHANPFTLGNEKQPKGLYN